MLNGCAPAHPILYCNLASTFPLSLYLSIWCYLRAGGPGQIFPVWRIIPSQPCTGAGGAGGLAAAAPHRRQDCWPAAQRLCTVCCGCTRWHSSATAYTAHCFFERPEHALRPRRNPDFLACMQWRRARIPVPGSFAETLLEQLRHQPAVAGNLLLSGVLFGAAT